MINVQALEDFNILLKGITKTTENEKKGRFLGTLLVISLKYVNRKRSIQS